MQRSNTTPPNTSRNARRIQPGRSARQRAPQETLHETRGGRVGSDTNGRQGKYASRNARQASQRAPSVSSVHSSEAGDFGSQYITTDGENSPGPAASRQRPATQITAADPRQTAAAASNAPERWGGSQAPMRHPNTTAAHSSQRMATAGPQPMPRPTGPALPGSTGQPENGAGRGLTGQAGMPASAPRAGPFGAPQNMQGQVQAQQAPRDIRGLSPGSLHYYAMGQQVAGTEYRAVSNNDQVADRRLKAYMHGHLTGTVNAAIQSQRSALPPQPQQMAPGQQRGT